MKIIIVGGVAGGATAATRLRRLSESDEIIIYEKDYHIAYANCGLPYFLGGTIKTRQALEVQSPKGLNLRFNVDVKTRHEVLSIDYKAKSVEVKDLETGDVFADKYDKLIISCGAVPRKPNIKGLDEAKNLFTLRNLTDTFEIDDYINKNTPKRAVVVGGGFIGVEMAENLKERGLDVTIVEKLPQLLSPIDFEMAQIVHGEINNYGVDIILGQGVDEFKDNGKIVRLEDGTELSSDLTIFSIGVVPESTLAKGANFKVGQRGHVQVDDNLNVLDEKGIPVVDVFAAGDMIEVINPIDDSVYAVPLAWGANRQGSLIADKINGYDIKAPKIMGASTLKVFSLTIASVGMNEKTLKAKKLDYAAVHAHRANHAGYYPGSSNISLKLLFDRKSGKIYGAQAVGRVGTEKRIDVITTAMRGGVKAWDLADLELCYAPPYSSAKDPVNILGYISENIVKERYIPFYVEEVQGIIKDKGFIVDVRTPFEFKNGSIETAINIEVDSIRKNLDKFPEDKNAKIYIFCQVGLRGYIASMILKNSGYKKIYNLSGGYYTYKTYSRKLCVVECEEMPIIGGGDIQMSESIKDEKNIKTVKVDACGLQCPGPLMAIYKAMQDIDKGQMIEVEATDPGFYADVQSWCTTNGHLLKTIKNADGKTFAKIQKGTGEASITLSGSQENATIVLFSGDLDKAIASMIIAQGAAAQGKKVTIFFTFWGLNILRRANKVKVKKTFIEKMFGFMMPRGAKKAKLSKMHMAGMGSAMIRGIMKKKNVDALPTMIENAKEAGVNMIACTMSMDLMGIKKEELLDGVEYAGVATYISRNENVGTTLFI